MDGEFKETASMSNDGRSVSQLRLPPGFRFKPTDPELICDYLKKQVNSESFEIRVIAEVDLSKYSPRELPGQALCGEDEWFFFTRLEKKYPKGTRPNRAAGNGFWKATGTDKQIFKANHIGHRMLVGLRKALVFYEGKPPRGDKTNWIMHEYRLAEKEPPAAQIHHRGSTLTDDWVLCRIYKKNSSLAQRAVGREHDLESMLSEFDEQIPPDSPPQVQEVVDNATTSTFPAMMHNIPGAMSSTVPGMQQTVVSSSSWTSQHTIASSSLQARLTHEFAVPTGLQTGPALNYLPQLQQFHQGPRSSSSFTGPEYYNACIGADAGQRSSYSDDFEEVESQFENFPSYGEGDQFPGFDHPPADDQYSTYPRPIGMGNFGYGQPPGRNSYHNVRDLCR